VKQPFVFRVTGWKYARKTTLTERLVAEFVRRGWRVDDQARPPCGRHRPARHRLLPPSRGGRHGGALICGQRYAIMREQAEPSLADVLARQRCRSGADRRLQARAASQDRGAGDVPSLAANDPAIAAIAADARPADTGLPWFRRDDIASIADFIAGRKV
jgi:molybdopterin-guanine dinucleotide biosynthesis protein B